MGELSRQGLLGTGPPTCSVGEESSQVLALSVHFLSFPTDLV